MSKKKASAKSRAKRRKHRTKSSIRKSRTIRAQMLRRSSRPSLVVKDEPETRLNMEFKTVIARYAGDTSIDKCISYFDKKRIPYRIVPKKIMIGVPCIVISEDHTHAGFFDGNYLWNPNDEPGGNGTDHGDGFDDLKIRISKTSSRKKYQIIATVPRGFTRCNGPGKSHNKQGLYLDSKGHKIPSDMIDSIKDEGGQCLLLSLGYYQYAIKQNKDLCDITNLTHLEVMELAKKIFKRDIPY